MTNLGSRRASASLPATVAWVAGGSLILAASAQIAVPIPFSPVPVTLQTLGLALVVALLGTRLGALATIAYLGEGAVGFPVFAQHVGGFIWLLGPSAGYLWAFVPAAIVLGLGFERGWNSPAYRFITVVSASAVVFAGGAAWLAHCLGSIGPALAAGVYPFVLGDAVKAIVAAAVAPAVRRFGPLRG